MLMLVILRIEETFSFTGRYVQGKPTLVVRMNNLVIINTGFDEPVSDSRYRLLTGGKLAVNLVCSPVLAEVWGRGMRAVMDQNLLLCGSIESTHTSIR